jgi:hypothetical protein
MKPLTIKTVENFKPDQAIRQQRWPDDDQMIFIGPTFQALFIDKLTDALGIPSMGGPEPKATAVRK